MVPQGGGLVPMQSDRMRASAQVPVVAPSSRRIGSDRHVGRALGQHYLVDSKVLRDILDAAELGPEDTVVEVGPGKGALTRLLVRHCGQVVAIELDGGLAASLARRLGSPSNLRVVHADAREVDLREVLAGETVYKMVSNLPYYAATPIIRRFLEAEGSHPAPTLMVVTVQREVARSMAAWGGKMSLLAVGVQLYGVPRIVCSIPPMAFSPPPAVTSALVTIDPRPAPAIYLDDVGAFFRLVRAGFSAPRKQLRNSLSLGLDVPPERARQLLEAAGVDPALRPQDLGLEAWGDLYRACKSQG